jgi:opacity protein-like surface antigen
MAFQSRARTALLMIVLLPAAANADWIFTPHFGTTFGADTHGREHAVIGGALAKFDEDAFGWEADISFVPDFFKGRYGVVDFTGSNSSVLSFMGNALIGIPVSGQHRDRFRPYVTIGVGLMQMHVESPVERSFLKTTTWEPGMNAGAGGVGFITSRVGLRGDVRYIRSFRDQPPSWTSGIDFDVAPGNFDFFRATFGLTIRVGKLGDD